jgi:hypothetical protein
VHEHYQSADHKGQPAEQQQCFHHGPRCRQRTGQWSMIAALVTLAVAEIVIDRMEEGKRL